MFFWTALAASAFLSVAGADGRCQKGWHFFQDSCYYVGTNVFSYFDADYECWYEDGKLAEISSKEENDYIKGLLGNASGTMTGVRNAYIGAYLDSEYIYDDRDPTWFFYNEWIELPFTDWADPDWEPEPDSDETEYCASMSMDVDWAWVVGSCEEDRAMAYVCKGEPTDDVSCYQDSCYEIMDYTYYFSEIQDKCKDAGGNVVEINSVEESVFLTRYLQKKWTTRYGHVWLGATDADFEGEFRWLSTKEKIDYENWSVGEPNNSGVGGIAEDCVFLDETKDFSWNDADCNGDFALVCEFSTSSGISARKEIVTAKKCNWYFQKCLYIFVFSLRM